jgi:hypothetical protein
MTSDRGAGGGRFARAVRETLDAVVAPVVRDALIHDALDEAGLPEIPEDVPALRKFANGSLLLVAERALGAEFAESIADEIVHRVRADSDPASFEGPQRSVRPDTPEPQSAPASGRMFPPSSGRGGSASPGASHSAAPPSSGRRDSDNRGSSAAPGVAPPSSRRQDSDNRRSSVSPVASHGVAPPSSGRQDSDATAWPTGLGSYIRPNNPRAKTAITPARPIAIPPRETRAFSEWFGERAEVCRVRTATEVVRGLDGAQDRRRIVILDGKSPSIRPPTLAVLLEDEPDVEVVLCRVAEATELVVLSGHPSTRQWLVYREPASLDHVAAECARLVS